MERKAAEGRGWLCSIVLGVWGWLKGKTTGAVGRPTGSSLYFLFLLDTGLGLLLEEYGAGWLEDELGADIPWRSGKSSCEMRFAKYIMPPTFLGAVELPLS